ncbi:MAG: hypothetical protein ACOX31_08965 [Eubacteriales bacterium]|jgi:hypothetical protein
MRTGSFFYSRKFRYGSLSITLTALVIALVVLLNAGVSALSSKYGLYIDLTAEQIYTLSDACRELLDTNFKTTAAEREAFNQNLPQTNYKVAQTNLARAADSQKNAGWNVELADRNIAIIQRNLELFSKSMAIAESNLAIAQDNLELAQKLYDYVSTREGEDTENTLAAAAILAAAEENLAVAEANIDIVAANRAAASGFTPLADYDTLEQLERYKFFEPFAPQIVYEDSTIAAENKAIAEENLDIAARNVEIAASNLEIARKNAEAGAVPGSANHKDPQAYVPYKPFVKFTTYQKINGAETPREYESYLETEAESKLVGEMKVDIIFCDDRDAILENPLRRYVLETAEDLERAFPDIIKVKFINVWKNPSAVQKYKGTALSQIYSTNVIVESGTEWRVYALNAFFVFSDTDSTTPWSYNGEKKFAAAILSVIKAESPIACVTINHGEAFTDYELLGLLADAGYIVQPLDLATQEIPEDCRLIVVYNPTSDFLVKDNVSDISEIAKLNAWLDEFNSLMVFMSPSSPVLPNLEEYLEEWGIVFDRTRDPDTGEVYPHMIKDSGQSLTADGMTIIAEYTEKGLGASIHTDMRSVPYPAKVIFKDTMSISYAPAYSVLTYEDEEDPTNKYRYGSYYSNGVTRNIFDVFASSPNAVALAAGEQVAAANSLEPFRLMTITRETQMVSNTEADYSYVIACASTAFASRELLQSNVYGNSDALLSVLRQVSKETIVVDLPHKPFAKTDIESITTAEANQYTIVLSVIPATVALGIGIFVTVRRRYS